MIAAYYEQAGSAGDVLTVGVQPKPELLAGEVLIGIKASGVNPSDVKTRAGVSSVHSFPRVIPHSDGAGVIVEVGKDVDPSRIGERVWTWNAQWKRPFGTAAELIALPSKQAVTLPECVSFAEGACLGVPWLTAWRAVHYRPIARDGEALLVAGGAGSVGFYAIQLAKRAGFRVATTVSSQEKAQVARSAGADFIIDYKRDDVAAAIGDFTDGRGLDRIVEVDLARNAVLYPNILCKDGLVIVYGSSDWSASLPLAAWLQHGVEMAIFIVYELAQDIRDAAVHASRSILADGSFKHLLAARFPLVQIVKAHEFVESRKTLGNVVLDVG